MSAKSRLLICVAAAAAVVLSACGGGGPTQRQPEPYSTLCTAATDPVTFADAVLEGAVRAGLNKATGTITCSDMEELTFLDATPLATASEDGSINVAAGGVTNLAGLQYAVNLTDLRLRNNDVSSISQISGLTKLEILDLYNTNVTDLSPVADLTELTYLSLGRTPFTSLEALRNLTKLQDLFICCNPNNFTDFTPLQGLTSLQRIDLIGFDIADDVLWPLLANYPNLTSLWATATSLSDFGALASISGLTHVTLLNALIPDLSEITALTNLTGLGLDSSVLGDPSQLAAMTQLESLSLYGAGITNIDFITGLVNLRELYLTNNGISDLGPLVANPGLGAGALINLLWNPLAQTDLSVAADLATLRGRGATVNLFDGGSHSDIKPAVQSPALTVQGMYPAAANMYGAIAANFRRTPGVVAEWEYVFDSPFMPYEVGSTGAFTVTLDPTPEVDPPGTLFGSCDFSGTKPVSLMGFFDEEVTQVFNTDGPTGYALDTDEPVYVQFWWYLPDNRTYNCENRVIMETGPASYVMNYQLDLVAGWNNVIRYSVRALSSGQGYFAFRTGSVAVDGVLNLRQP